MSVEYTVILYSLATPRMNYSVAILVEILNNAEFYYWELNCRLIYKITNLQTAPRQEF